MKKNTRQVKMENMFEKFWKKLIFHWIILLKKIIFAKVDYRLCGSGGTLDPPLIIRLLFDCYLWCANFEVPPCAVLDIQGESVFLSVSIFFLVGFSCTKIWLQNRQSFVFGT